MALNPLMNCAKIITPETKERPQKIIGGWGTGDREAQVAQ